MKYNLHNQFVVNQNVLKPRSYYIPFSDKNFSLDKSKSKQVTLLSKWKFAYFPCFNDEIINEEPSEEMDIPFCWQRKGYDYDQYLNTELPFACEPPLILKDNPCGVYVTNYHVDNKFGKYYLNFEGVSSCLYLFINDKYVGYATITHSINEFDVTKFINNGNNKIKVIVLKWCAGSYLEDQDMPYMHGIFRDVYMLNRPENHIWDYKISPNMNGDITVELDKQATVELYDKDKLIDSQSGKELKFKINNPILWNAENPYLYRMIICCNGEYVEENVGLRSVKIKDAIFYLNNVPIKIKGVNRHSSTVNGYCENINDLEKDLKLFKKFNINAVRTSHYPPQPIFTKLCEQYGIYVLLEADLEAHISVYYKGEKSDFSEFSENKNFEEMYFQRVTRAYERDKNRTSVIIWSLGNESGWSYTDEGYSNFLRAGQYIKERDNRPIHYESFILPWIDGEWYFRKEHILDFYSRMYPPFRDIDRFFDGFYTKEHLNMEERPFILCEYSFAYGNGSGDVKYFWDHYINKIPQFVGGFIWQWNDLGAYDKEGKYISGKDFGTYLNCGHYCACGLVDLDRKFLHSSLYEVSEAYSPFDVRYEEGKFYIKNMHDFTTLDEYQLKYQIKENGTVKEEKTLQISDILPRKEKEIAINNLKKYSGYVTVDFILYNEKLDSRNVRQIIIDDKFPITKFVSEKVKYNVGNKIITFNKHGLIEQIEIDGNKLFNKPMEICVYRAPTDNDVYINKQWQKYFLDKASFFGTDLQILLDKIIATGYVCYEYRQPIGKVIIIYEFNKEKDIQISIEAKINECIPALPRFGVRLTLNKDMRNVTYFGAGTIEAYEDKHAHSPVGLYESTVDDMQVNYIKPQESGAHAFSRMVQLSNNNLSLKIESSANFSFNVSKYDLYNLPYHNYDLIDSENTYLNIDYRNSPVGSMGCNHVLNEPFTYTFTEKEFKYSFILKFEHGR